MAIEPADYSHRNFPHRSLNTLRLFRPVIRASPGQAGLVSTSNVIVLLTDFRSTVFPPELRAILPLPVFLPFRQSGYFFLRAV